MPPSQVPWTGRKVGGNVVGGRVGQDGVSRRLSLQDSTRLQVDSHEYSARYYTPFVCLNLVKNFVGPERRVNDLTFFK